MRKASKTLFPVPADPEERERQSSRQRSAGAREGRGLLRWLQGSKGKGKAHVDRGLCAARRVSPADADPIPPSARHPTIQTGAQEPSNPKQLQSLHSDGSRSQSRAVNKGGTPKGTRAPRYSNGTIQERVLGTHFGCDDPENPEKCFSLAGGGHLVFFCPPRLSSPSTPKLTLKVTLLSAPTASFPCHFQGRLKGQGTGGESGKPAGHPELQLSIIFSSLCPEATESQRPTGQKVTARGAEWRKEAQIRRTLERRGHRRPHLTPPHL